MYFLHNVFLFIIIIQYLKENYYEQQERFTEPV